MLQKIRMKLWSFAARLYPRYLRKVYGMEIAATAIISYRAKLDKSNNPRGIHIGEHSWILANAVVLAHDHCRGLRVDTYIGHNCVIGINAIVMPGVKIGNHVVVGSGSVVTKDVDSHCVAAGNPARVIKEGIIIDEEGRIVKP